MTPKFTVIMTVYGRESLTLRALHCLLSQSVWDWELLILADGLHPNTAAAIAQFRAASGEKRRIEYFDMDCPRGTYGNPLRRMGLSQADGDYVCFVGHDCLLDTGYLAAHQDNIATLAPKPCISLVSLRYWHLRGWNNKDVELPIEQYRGILPCSKPGDQLQLGELDLTCCAYPLGTAKRLQLFREEWDTTYEADFLSFDLCRQELPVVLHPAVVGAHF